MPQTLSTYRLADLTIAIAFPDPAIGRIIDAYYHLAASTAPATIRLVFESYNAPETKPNPAAVEHIQLPTPGFSIHYNTTNGTATCRYPAEAFVTPESDTPCRMRYENSLDHSPLPPHSSGVLSAVTWLLERLGIITLHAAAAVYRGQTILLPGVGGIGKTTTAINLAQDRGRLLADDRIYMRHTDADGLQAWGSPKRLAVTATTADYFPATFDRASLPDEYLGKYHLAPEATAIDFDTSAHRPDLMLMPVRIDAPTPRTARLAPMEAFTRLFDGRVCYPPTVPEHLAMQLDILEALTEHVPAYDIEQGPDMAANRRVIRQLMGSAR